MNDGNGGGPGLGALVDGLSRARQEIARVIVGQKDVVDLTLTALLCEAHILYEGVPGLGKTMLVRALADALDMRFSRIQFTPDLMPSDVLGSTFVNRSEKGDIGLDFECGPVFANLVLADEINRASPKTQSALLEAMQERSVTVRGKTYPLPRPFQVMATQNPLEMEGTYPLPEAQVDRFLLKASVPHPEREDLVAILERTSGAEQPRARPVLREEDVLALQAAVKDIVAPPVVLDLASRLVLASRPEHPSSPAKVKKFVRFGSGPRGAQALVMAAKAKALMEGRLNASTDDVLSFAGPALRHRIHLNFEAQSEGLGVDEIVKEVAFAASSSSGADRRLA